MKNNWIEFERGRRYILYNTPHFLDWLKLTMIRLGFYNLMTILFCGFVSWHGGLVFDRLKMIQKRIFVSTSTAQSKAVSFIPFQYLWYLRRYTGLGVLATHVVFRTIQMDMARAIVLLQLLAKTVENLLKEFGGKIPMIVVVVGGDFAFFDTIRKRIPRKFTSTTLITRSLLNMSPFLGRARWVWTLRQTRNTIFDPRQKPRKLRRSRPLVCYQSHGW